jgi:hypothetical protein
MAIESFLVQNASTTTYSTPVTYDSYWGVILLPGDDINPGGILGGMANTSTIRDAGGLFIGIYDIKIKTFDYETSSTHYWHYDIDGSLTFPDGSVQTTAFTGTIADLTLPLYTTSTLNTIVSTATGAMVLVTDLVGGSLPCFYDGADWKTFTGTII